MDKYYDIVNESYKLSLSIIKIYKFLCSEKNEYNLSKQFLRSGTSIGANVKESQDGQSKKDFLSKMSISLKEAKETDYRLSLLFDSGYLDGYKEFERTKSELSKIIGVLTKIIKTTKANLTKEKK